MEKSNKLDWLADYQQINKNPNFFIEEYYNKLHPDNQIFLTDEEKEYVHSRYNLDFRAWIDRWQQELEPKEIQYDAKDNPFKVGDIITEKNTRTNRMEVKEIQGVLVITRFIDKPNITCRGGFHLYEKVKD